MRPPRPPARAPFERGVELTLLGSAGLVLVIAALVLGALGHGMLAGLAAGAAVPGLGALVLGTLWTAGIALLVAAPLGLLAAIYLAEFASAAVARVLEPVLAILSAVPTVIWAGLALSRVVPGLLAAVPGAARASALAPGLVVGLMLVPMVAVLGAAVLRAVPRSLREAAWALGAGEAQTLLTIVIPSAARGLVATLMLALARAIGETVVVTLVLVRSFAGVETLTTAVLAAPAEPSSLVFGACVLSLGVAAGLAARRLGVWPNEVRL